MEMNSIQEEADDDDSFVEFYRHYLGRHPKHETDQQYVKEMKTARRESKERRNDSKFEKQFEDWWKKCTKDDVAPSLLLKEQLRGKVHFKKK